MGMNPDTNRFEELSEGSELKEKFLAEYNKCKAHSPEDVPGTLFRPNGEPVPKTWTVFEMGENVVIKNYTFKVAYIGETSVLFEPVGPVILGNNEDQ